MTMITSEMILQRPVPFVGMPFWSVCDKCWRVVSKSNDNTVNHVSLLTHAWASGKSTVRLPSEPECPPLPPAMQGPHVPHLALARSGRGPWFVGMYGGSSSRAIPVRNDYVLCLINDAQPPRGCHLQADEGGLPPSPPDWGLRHAWLNDIYRALQRAGHQVGPNDGKWNRTPELQRAYEKVHAALAEAIELVELVGEKVKK